MNNQRLKQLLSFFNEGSKDPFIKYAIATEYLKEREIDLALQFYEDLIQNHPDYIGTYYHLGKLYNQLGRLDAAITVLEKGILEAKKIHDTHALSELQQIYDAFVTDTDDD